jgi:AcrR family transcriptional regulator
MARRRRIQDAELLAVARGLFLQRGLQVSTRELAKEMGISEGVLFQRFKTKDNLIAMALAVPAFDAERLITEGATGKDAREILENIAIVIYHEFYRLVPLSIPQLLQTEFRDEHFWSRKSPFPSFVAALEGHLKSERQQGRIKIESPHTTADFLVSALHNQALLDALAALETNDGKVRDWIGVLWRGLDPRL